MTSSAFSTPMMKQYREIKKNYEDCLLFYRMGDFYELFLDDAVVGARVLGITLTGKSNGKNERIPMAGVPYHAVDSYLNKLVKAGFKVAICEQMSLPNKKELVKREVVRVVTPGTVIDEKALEQKQNNYIVSLILGKNQIAIAVADISTGYFAATEFVTENYEQIIKNEFAKINPAECILSDNLYNDPQLLTLLKSQKNMNIYCFQEWNSYGSHADKFLLNHFGINTLAAFTINSKPLAKQASAALLGYLKQTQKNNAPHIKKISSLDNNDHLVMDKATMINLELFSTIREHDTKDSLLATIDETISAMGGRMLRSWIYKPLAEKTAIEKRHDAVENLINDSTLQQKLQDELKMVIDIERVLSRLSLGLGNGRDLVSLKESLLHILQIKNELETAKSDLLLHLSKQISKELQKLIDAIAKTIVDEPPIAIKEGGLIKKGVSEQLDKLRSQVGNSKQWMIEFEEKERQRSGISSLKVRFNKVFGFYIEISKTNLHLVPDDYQRKQTLVGGERFVTKELKEQEEFILSSEEIINQREYEIFLELLNKILANIETIQLAAENIAMLDCLMSFAIISQRNDYTRPKLIYSGEITIKNGRHPVVETLVENSQFVPNDVLLDNISQQLLLITGPNMAGKSVFIRQVALICLLNQIGCFVPAEKAYLSIVDRIFVRSGASDVITSGLSTFMVEMVETASILHNATKNSLIVMDEIGRGTSTYDGISIAWAVAEYLVNHFDSPPKTLFATHYHELQELEQLFPNKVKNYHMAVVNSSEDSNFSTNGPVFLHTILPGPASHSFGVAVAKLAGIPEDVIKNANEKLEKLEKNHLQQNVIANETEQSQYNVIPAEAGIQREPWSPDRVRDDNVTSFNSPPTTLIDHLIRKELGQLNIANMTPLEALNKLAQLKEQLSFAEKETEQLLKID